MDEQRIKQLIDLLADSDLGELTFSEGGSTLTIKRKATAEALPRTTDAPPAAKPAAAMPATSVAAPLAAVEAAITEVRAPLYGVLHLTPSPDEPPFVTQGQHVAAGAVLCLVEAMKMFHQVKAPYAGVVERILAEPGQEIEADQPLFSLRAPEASA